MSPMACRPSTSFIPRFSEACRVSVNTPDGRPAIAGFADHSRRRDPDLFLLSSWPVAEFGWVLRIPIRGAVLPLAFAGSCLVSVWGARTYFRRPCARDPGGGRASGIARAVSARISVAFYDVSFDGQAYQQEGVYQLAQGWNPLFTHYLSPISIDQNVKLIHYPKGPWIIGAAMYRLTAASNPASSRTFLLLLPHSPSRLQFLRAGRKG